MKIVILCGGQGTRLREETEYRPKPMVPIGRFPILWHIMKIYSYNGNNNFVLALGYKGDMIKEYFMNYRWHSSDFTLNIKTKQTEYHNFHELEDWNITFADTGLESLTGLRLIKLKRYLEDDEMFMLTYGDGVSDIDIKNLVKFHKEKGKLVTITGVNPVTQYGVIDVDNKDIAKGFREKPSSKDIINGGFMVINKGIFKYLHEDENIMFEDILVKLSDEGHVAIFPHKGFWHSMDTYRDYLKLNKMWDEKNRPWAVWEKNAKP
jgi:glucose-1-phosphate cytidylyltransferase